MAATTTQDGAGPRTGAGRGPGVGTKIGLTVGALVGLLVLVDVLRLADPVGTTAGPSSGADGEQRRLVLLVAVVAALGLLMVLVAVVVRATARLRGLTAVVRRAASDGLPAVFERVGRMPADGVPPVLPPYAVDSRDELCDLAAALTSLQRTTVGLAVEQRRRELGTVETLLALARRNQALLARVQAHVTQLQEVTGDPEVMAALFRIDRTTARARRTADSMLVVAGAGPAPAREVVVPVSDVVSTALGQVEDDVRVDLHRLQDTGVVGAVATDLVHLLAELLENATRFSPPTSRVVVLGRGGREGYRLQVVDAGTGMSLTELAAANAALDRASAAPEGARRLGLHVVARLAARHDLVVRLEPSQWGGLDAVVLLPAAAVRPLPQAGRVVDVTDRGHASADR